MSARACLFDLASPKLRKAQQTGLSKARLTQYDNQTGFRDNLFNQFF
jgi:hypothetical protein